MNVTPDVTDGRPAPGAAIGVVTVCEDDPAAPGGCAALRELQGSTLLARSVAALVGSGVVGEIVVAVPPAVAPLVGHLLVGHLLVGQPLPGHPPQPAGAADGAVPALRVHPVGENGHGHRARAALRLADPPADRPVVVHDPLFPLAPPGLVRAVVEALRAHEDDGRCVVAVPVRPVTDTLKWVDEDHVVLATADREQFLMVYSPQAYWPGGLASTLDRADAELLREAAGPDVLPGLIQAGGGLLLPVPAPGEVFRIATPEDLVLADAMLHVGAAGDDGPDRR